MKLSESLVIRCLVQKALIYSVKIINVTVFIPVLLLVLLVTVVRLIMRNG
jgi:hypothetical protein